MNEDVSPLEMDIFYGYASLPEGNLFFFSNRGLMFSCYKFRLRSI